MNNELNNESFNNPFVNQSQMNITVRITRKEELHRFYMPFIKNGGIFISTNQQYRLGDELTLNLSLLDEKTTYTLNTRVVWINPTCAQEGLPKGVGVQFIDEEAEALRIKIENYLAGFAASHTRTDTM